MTGNDMDNTSEGIGLTPILFSCNCCMVFLSISYERLQ
jgi:hypothetical protein